MTRDEERTKAAKDYADSIAQHEHNKLYSIDDFKAGAKWADEHPLDKTIEDFPELKESEKIRKTLIRFHKSTIDIDAIKGEDILAWLEKQGNQREQLINKACECLAENCTFYFDHKSCESELTFIENIRRAMEE